MIYFLFKIKKIELKLLFFYCFILFSVIFFQLIRVVFFTNNVIDPFNLITITTIICFILFNVSCSIVSFIKNFTIYNQEKQDAFVTYTNKDTILKINNENYYILNPYNVNKSKNFITFKKYKNFLYLL